jgi:uncharacterized OB-fold protein
LSGRPVVPGHFVETADGPRLRGSRCRSCATVSFPAAPFCPNPDCPKDRALVDEWLGGQDGVLWSWTIQHLQAPPPFRFDHEGPYAVGMVDLPEGIRVLGLLTRSTGLRHDMPVTLVSGQLYEDDSGPVVTWMWEPR